MDIEREITIEVTCPHCGTEFEQDVWVSIEVEPSDVRDGWD